MLEHAFPRLGQNGYRITSQASQVYNCIAWAANDTGNWWWPLSRGRVNYWPLGAPRDESVSAFQAAFAVLGYLWCNDELPESGFEKIALFADAHDMPTHAARQLDSGLWTSKLGELQDIEHQLRDLEGAIYGTVACIMRRPKS